MSIDLGGVTYKRSASFHAYKSFLGNKKQLQFSGRETLQPQVQDTEKQFVEKADSSVAKKVGFGFIIALATIGVGFLGYKIQGEFKELKNGNASIARTLETIAAPKVLKPEKWYWKTLSTIHYAVCNVAPYPGLIILARQGYDNGRSYIQKLRGGGGIRLGP